MPKTEVVFYKDDDGSVPVLDWLVEIGKRNKNIPIKFRARRKILEEHGRSLHTHRYYDYLNDGIWELRFKDNRIQCRILFFYHGRNITVLSHAITKEDKIPRVDLETALLRKQIFEADPVSHTYEEDDNEN